MMACPLVSKTKPPEQAGPGSNPGTSVDSNGMIYEIK